jgi:Holliday junction resolvase RusA-like endonuclease
MEELLTLSFTVEGRPAPQGSKSPKGVNKKTGRVILAESSKYVKPWRKAVEEAALEAIASSGWTTTDHPVLLLVEFHLHRPANRPRRVRVLPTKYPDLSKLVRSTEDALTTAHVWGDDAQITDEVISKRYAVTRDLPIYLPSDHEVPGATITVVELPHEEML